jgi:hypothetical protein
VIEGVEKLRTELQGRIFPDSSDLGCFDQRDIPVELPWAEKNAEA